MRSEKLAGGRQRAGAPIDQPRPKLPLKVGNMLGDRRLTDPQLVSGSRK
jgi:hypothetical protein